MAKLENPKHESFAGHLARGLPQAKAYVQAGYTNSPQAASRLAKHPMLIQRVEELKGEIQAKIHHAMSEPNEETFQSLKDMGLTMEWVAHAFKNIYEESLAAGQFAPANTAVTNIQKLIEIERSGKNAEEDTDAPKLGGGDISAIQQVVGDIRAIAEAARDAALSEKNSNPEMVDITPDSNPENPDGYLIEGMRNDADNAE